MQQAKSHLLFCIVDNVNDIVEVVCCAPILSKLIMAPVAFTEHQDLVLETPDLNAGRYVITHIAETIQVYEQPFTLWTEA